MTDQFMDPAPGRHGTAEQRADVDKDHFERYMLPLYGQSKPVARTRVSTAKSALIQTKGIELWRSGLIADGMSANPDLIAAAAAARMNPDKAAGTKQLRSIADEAFVRAGGKSRAQLGTDIHKFTERRNRGEDLPIEMAPPEHRRDIDAYDQLLSQFQVQPLAEYLERQVSCHYDLCGSVDNIVRWWNPDTDEWEIVVADLKTGRDLTHGWVEIQQQLWLYANAVAMWDASTSEWGPMPVGLRKDRALIFHVPVNGTAELIVVDLGGVGEWVAASMLARRIAKEAIHKVRTIGRVDLRGAAYMITEKPDTTIPEPVGPEVPDVPNVSFVAPESKHRQGFITAPALPGPVLNGIGKPLEPIAEPGKKGCSVCRRVGHRKGSPACLTDRDPDLKRPTGQNQVTSEPVAPDEIPEADIPPVTETVVEDMPWCTDSQPQWRAKLGAKPNEPFVCGICGKPSKMVYEHGLSIGNDLPSWADPAPIPAEQDWVMLDMAKARTVDELLAVRQQALQRNAWVEANHDAFGKARYAKLSQPIQPTH